MAKTYRIPHDPDKVAPEEVSPQPGPTPSPKEAWANPSEIWLEPPVYQYPPMLSGLPGTEAPIFYDQGVSDIIGGEEAAAAAARGWNELPISGAMTSGDRENAAAAQYLDNLQKLRAQSAATQNIFRGAGWVDQGGRPMIPDVYMRRPLPNDDAAGMYFSPSFGYETQYEYGSSPDTTFYARGRNGRGPAGHIEIYGPQRFHQDVAPHNSGYVPWQPLPGHDADVTAQRPNGVAVSHPLAHEYAHAVDAMNQYDATGTYQTDWGPVPMKPSPALALLNGLYGPERFGRAVAPESRSNPYATPPYEIYADQAGNGLARLAHLMPTQPLNQAQAAEALGDAYDAYPRPSVAQQRAAMNLWTPPAALQGKLPNWNQALEATVFRRSPRMPVGPNGHSAQAVPATIPGTKVDTRVYPAGLQEKPLWYDEVPRQVAAPWSALAPIDFTRDVQPKIKPVIDWMEATQALAGLWGVGGIPGMDPAMYYPANATQTGWSTTVPPSPIPHPHDTPVRMPFQTENFRPTGRTRTSGSDKK